MQHKKNYVTVYLMQIFMNSAMLAEVSPAPKKRMQGKGCFNFMAVDEGQFKKLESRVAAGLEGYRKMGWV